MRDFLNSSEIHLESPKGNSESGEVDFETFEFDFEWFEVREREDTGMGELAFVVLNCIR